MKVNRKIAPKYHTIETIDILKAEKSTLKNNIPVFTINAGDLEVIKIDLIFKAGYWYQDIPLVSSISNALLTEGSKNYTGKEIAEKLDFYGAILGHNVDKDFATLNLYTLNKYLPQTINILADIVKNPVYPQKELDTYLLNKKQQFSIDNEKVKTLAYRKFWEVLFGKDHPYGRILELNHFDKIDQKQLFEFHKRHYNADNCKIIISGNIDDRVLNQIEENLGSNDWILDETLKSKTDYKIASSEKMQHIIKKDDAVQSALRLGKPIINKLHKDYAGLQVLNTVLGGYFGSRLMSNIREDKGYTYGIGSALISLQNGGYFTIVTEVGSNVTKSAVEEISNELKTLRNDLVPKDEMRVVKNYMLGELLKAFDGPFALAESLRSIIDYNLDYTYFNDYIETVKNINPEELNKLTNKYLQEDSIFEVIAGKYE